MQREQNRPGPSIIRWLMWIYGIANILILLYLFYNSLRPRMDILSNTMGVPAALNLANYGKLLGKEHFLRYFFNSMLILVGAILLSVSLSSTVAYALGHYKFRFRQTLKTYFLIGLMFPIQLGIVPVFLMMKGLGLINTFTSVILISGSGISMAVFLLSSFFGSLPDEIYEAAILDGAGEFRTFLQIMFPLASPVVFSMSILTAVNIWNQFFVPLIFLQNDAKKTIPLMVIKYTKKLLTTVDLAFAVSILSTVPILLLFVLFSKKVLSGIAEGGVKG